MIYVIFVNNSGQKLDIFENILKNKEKITNIFFGSENLAKHIFSSENEKIMKRRYAAYFALEFAYKKLFGEEMQIEFSEFGRPCIQGKSDIDISISHGKKISLIAISCGEGKIGVDIEELIDGSRAERINKRFLSSIKLPEKNISSEKISLMFLNLACDGELLSEKFSSLSLLSSEKGAEKFSLPCIETTDGEEKNNEEKTTREWTQLEALLKAEGRGFGAYSEISNISNLGKCSSYILNYEGDNSYISVAVFNSPD